MDGDVQAADGVSPLCDRGLALLWVLAGQTCWRRLRAPLHCLWLRADCDGRLGLRAVRSSAWEKGPPMVRTNHRHRPLCSRRRGLRTGWPKEAPRKSGQRPRVAGFTVNWEKWKDPEAVASAQKAGHFVYVDFTARWCATCQTNKAAVFHSDEVLAEFGRRNVILLRGDWTSKDPAITAELARWNRSAVPFNLIYAPDKPNPVILPELLTPRQSAHRPGRSR